MSAQLNRAYGLVNLRRAWTYLKSNPDPFYKSDFRPQYDAFGAVAERSLLVMRKQLSDGSYEPKEHVAAHFVVFDEQDAGPPVMDGSCFS